MTIEGTSLKAANVGDSGFMVMRKDKVVMRSPAQQHQFNFPYQIGGPDCGSDPPQSAEVGASCPESKLESLCPRLRVIHAYQDKDLQR